jgi:NADH-quinone oxidoreductase subunit J
MYDISFYIMALFAVGGALGMLCTRNLFRAALLLVLVFFTIAGVYVALSADFLAVVQVMVYVGAVAILVILGIMLTRDLRQGNFPNKLRLGAFIVCAMVFGLLCLTFVYTKWQISPAAPIEPTTGALGLKLFAENGYLLPVEIASVLILASVLGAIVILREK